MPSKMISDLNFACLREICWFIISGIVLLLMHFYVFGCFARRSGCPYWGRIATGSHTLLYCTRFGMCSEDSVDEF
jgi:hypothetical protein